MSEYKVVFHVNDLDRFDHAYSNITNMLHEKLDVDICLLLNGEAASLAHRDVRIGLLVRDNVDVNVCQNSLNSLKIDSSKILEGIRIVPSGVVELMIKQKAGYGYIKP